MGMGGIKKGLGFKRWGKNRLNFWITKKIKMLLQHKSTDVEVRKPVLSSQPQWITLKSHCGIYQLVISDISQPDDWRQFDLRHRGKGTEGKCLGFIVLFVHVVCQLKNTQYRDYTEWIMSAEAGPNKTYVLLRWCASVCVCRRTHISLTPN